MDDTENSGVSWLSHPKRMFKGKNKCSLNPKKSQSEPIKSYTEMGVEQIITAKECGDRSENESNDAPSNVGKKESSREAVHGIVENCAYIRNESQAKAVGNSDKHCETEPGFKTNIEMEDELIINKLRTDMKLSDSLKKLSKVFDDTSETGNQKKKILYDIISNVAACDNEEMDNLLELATRFKTVMDLNSFKKNFVDKYPIETHDFLDAGMSGNINFGYCLKNGNKQKVAIKKPKPGFTAKVVVEAAKLALFDHKNIIKVIAASLDEPKIALEYMELGSLVSALKNQPFSDLELLNIIKDVATGMEYLHAQDYIHADLSCSNVLVNSKKECKICDFGESYYVGYTNGDRKLDIENVKTLALEILPPELWYGHLGKSSDVWAMGILIYDIYEYASGKLPTWFRFVEMTQLQLGIRRLKQPTRCPKNIWIFTNEKILIRNKTIRTTFSAIREKFDQMLEQNRTDF